jgi:hypothetical protein
MSVPPTQVIVSNTQTNVVEVVTAGPQGPTGPMGNPGPTGPGVGATGPTGPPGSGGGGGGSLGQTSLSLRDTFTSAMANVPDSALIANYQFGSNATPGPGITTITSLSDLAANFNAFEDFTNQTSINSEIERYQPFNSANHVVHANDITLQVVNPNNDWQVTAISQISGTINRDNTPTPIANLGLANTSAVIPGQMAAIQGGGTGGNYMVTAVVTNVSVTLQSIGGAPTSGTVAGCIFWLPVVGVPLSSPFVDGGTQFTFASLPSFVKVGMALGVYNSPVNGVTLNRTGDYRVTNIAVSGSTVVTFSPPRVGLGNLGNGTIIWFLPAVTSGQIWSKLQLDLTNPQVFLALEFDMTTLGPAGANRSQLAPNGQLTLAQFNSIPLNTPMGGWPAYWMYSADDGHSTAESSSASEIDCVEIQIGCTQDGSWLNTGQVGVTGASAAVFTKNDSGWSSFAAFGIMVAPSGTNFVGRNLYRFIFCNGQTYRFFNDTLYRSQEFAWSNQHPTQFSIGIAAGGLNTPLTQNTIFPNNPLGFADMNVAMHSIKVWYQAAP